MIKKILLSHTFTGYSARRDLLPFALFRYYKFDGDPRFIFQIYYGWWKWSGIVDISIGDLPKEIN